MAGRKQGTPESSALVACARAGGVFREFARKRVQEHTRCHDNIPAALAGALGCSVRTAYRIIRAVQGNPPTARQLRAEA